jgi:ABC-type branched-subunit amino acid transport system permease subunit
MWSTILKLVLGALAELLLAFVANLRQARLDDPSIVAVVDRIVRGIAKDHPEWTGEQKRAHAIDSLKIYALNLRKDLSDSLAATLVELGVQRLKAS